MADDPKKAKQRLRYRKKAPSVDTSIEDISIREEKETPISAQKSRKSRQKPKPKTPEFSVPNVDDEDIFMLRRDREQLVQRQREHHQKQMEEKKKRELRERQQEILLKKVEEETVNKIVRAEVMYSLMQEHNGKTKSHAHHRGIHQLSPRHGDETYPFGFNPKGVTMEVLATSIRKWEEHLKRLLGGHRVADHERGVSCLRSACRESYRELLLKHADTCKKMDLNERLWMNWYKEIDTIQSKVRSLQPHPTDSLGGLTEYSRFRDELSALLATSTAFYNQLLHGLIALESRSPDVLHAIHMTLVALGDLSRYGQNVLPKQQRSWLQAESHYRTALQYNPSNGKVYNQLALLAFHRQQDFIEVAYLYCRSLSCSTPFCARENLMTTLTSTRLAPASDLKAQASDLLLRCYFRLFTGIDVGKLNSESSLAVECLRKLILQQHAGASLCTFFIQVMVLALFSVHNCQVSLGSASLAQDLHYDSQFTHWREDENVVSALDLAFKLGIVLCDGATMSEKLLSAILPSLNLLLDWLRVHPWFLELESSTISSFRISLEALLARVKSFRMLDISKLPKDHWESSANMLWEDMEMKGFLPLAKVNRCRKESKKPVENETNDFIPRLSRLFGFVSFATQNEWMNSQQDRLPRHSSVNSVSNISVTLDTTCIQCLNEIPTSATACGFCGYEICSVDTPSSDETETTAESNSNKSSPVRGVLSGVNWQAPKQQTPQSSKQKLRTGRPKRHIAPVNFLSAYDSDWKCLIVVDASNVAMRHGLNQRFSCKGIRLVFDFYLNRGHKVISFLPDYLLKYETVGAQKRMANVGFDVSPTKVPDDVSLLQSMVVEGLIIATPPQDYDDSYCIQYAGKHDGCVVTNDLFRDHVENIKISGQRAAMREWLKGHRISFTWVGDEYFPNPDFRFPMKQVANSFEDYEE